MKNTPCSIKPIDRISVKDYVFFQAKNMTKNIGKNIIENISGKRSQNLYDHDKQSSADSLKTASKKVIQKTAG